MLNYRTLTTLTRAEMKEYEKKGITAVKGLYFYEGDKLCYYDKWVAHIEGIGYQNISYCSKSMALMCAESHQDNGISIIPDDAVLSYEQYYKLINKKINKLSVWNNIR